MCVRVRARAREGLFWQHAESSRDIGGRDVDVNLGYEDMVNGTDVFAYRGSLLLDGSLPT
jgi:hypothetical protein